MQTGDKKQVMEDYHERSQIVNRFMVAAISQTDPVVSVIRRAQTRCNTGRGRGSGGIAGEEVSSK